MTNSTKIETLENAILSLNKYKKDFKDDSISSFEVLKAKILNVLTKNERIRFSQIEFFSEQDNFDEIMGINDDLPF